MRVGASDCVLLSVNQSREHNEYCDYNELVFGRHLEGVSQYVSLLGSLPFD